MINLTFSTAERVLALGTYAPDLATHDERLLVGFVGEPADPVRLELAAGLLKQALTHLEPPKR